MGKGLKTGGRQAGTPNRKTQEVTALLDGLDCNPIEGMVRIAKDEHADIGIRARLLSELAQYVFPKRKAMSVDMVVEQKDTFEDRLRKLRNNNGDSSSEV